MTTTRATEGAGVLDLEAHAFDLLNDLTDNHGFEDVDAGAARAIQAADNRDDLLSIISQLNAYLLEALYGRALSAVAQTRLDFGGDSASGRFELARR